MTRHTALLLATIFSTIIATLLIFELVTHEEPGFIEAVPQWQPSDFPLLVDYRDGRDVEPAIKRANQRLGFEAFTWAGDEDGDIIVRNAHHRVRTGSVAGGYSQLEIDQHIMVCRIRYNAIHSSHLLTQVLLHEFGHCLGLAHDRSGIMQEVTRETPDGVIPDTFTDYDRRIVRARYMR